MKIQVIFADTDAGGVVYYANYLRWLEMARWELMESLGTSVAEYARKGYIFAVVRVEIDYAMPALLGDQVEVDAEVERVRWVRFTLRQRVVRCADDRVLATAVVTLACVDPEAKPTRLPVELAAALRDRLAP